MVMHKMVETFCSRSNGSFNADNNFTKYGRNLTFRCYIL